MIGQERYCGWALESIGPPTGEPGSANQNEFFPNKGALLHTNTQFHFYLFFISPLFNQVGQLRTSSHLQLRPGQDKAKQCKTELNME